MQIHIEASELPGRTWGPGTGFAGLEDIHVGVQRKDRPGELLGVYPGDAPRADWTLDCTAVSTPEGVEISGPYIQNRLGGCFIYLSWGTVDGSGDFTMFRRAKLMTGDIDPVVVEAAARSGHLTARLRLSDDGGGPRCGRVRPADITWSATRSA
ncbi:DUF5990 family protein [Streptomyces sp. NBC_00178]|uniref:DUF5990 family protein n=1 Tax=Streptomyces sp. NBC_00178 TaxID=2975672 RepID=UPI002E2D7F41|nr:DUF5990 family protein [Streptomyces sp. NBC_00178]